MPVLTPRSRVLLADDHDLLMAIVADVLADEFEVLATVGNGEQAIVSATELEPDVVILDISMPNISGIEVASRLAALPRPPRVVFLTHHEDPKLVQAALASGAIGYVVKRRLAVDVLPALRSALSGRVFVSPAIGLAAAH
jgi:DNA-binding NarL/FixJ family response regulator